MTASSPNAGEDGSIPLFTGATRLTVLVARWMLLITLAYAIIFSSGAPGPTPGQQVFVAAILLSNLVLAWLLVRGTSWNHLSGWATAIDIGAVTLAMGVAGNVSTEFYMIYFSVLILAAVVDRIDLVIGMSLLACLAYLALLFAEHGNGLWTSLDVLVRLPVLIGVAIYFATGVRQARREILCQQRRLNLERGRALAALSEMARLALTGAPPRGVLHELAGWVQQILDVDRCSLVVIDEEGTAGYLAASGDDPGVEVLRIDLQKYPELEPVVATGEVMELHPGDPSELWENVRKCLPADSPFRSFLVIPITREQQVLGLFYLRATEPDRKFTEEHIAFCRQAAIMVGALIHEHRLWARLEEARRVARAASA